MDNNDYSDALVGEYKNWLQNVSLADDDAAWQQFVDTYYPFTLGCESSDDLLIASTPEVHPKG